MIRITRRCGGVTLSCAAALLLASHAFAAAPHIGRIAPVGGQRGTELDVVIAGARLGDAQELLLYYPGIRATKVEAQKNGAVNAHLAIAADCRLGLHALRLRTSTGISNLVTFSVGALPEIQESEPNNDFDNPQKIPLIVDGQWHRRERGRRLLRGRSEEGTADCDRDRRAASRRNDF